MTSLAMGTKTNVYTIFARCAAFYVCVSSCSDHSRCRWHTHLTNHIYFDYRKNPNTPNLSPHAWMKLCRFWDLPCISVFQQGLRASSPQFTSPLEFNAIFRDGFTLWLELNGWSKIRDPVKAKFKHVTVIVTCTLLCCDDVTYVRALWNFQKADLEPTLTAKNTPLFLFPYMGHSLQIFAWGIPLHAHVYSFTHNAVVLSHLRCVHPENQTKIFRF